MAPQSTKEMIDYLTFEETTAAKLRHKNGSVGWKQTWISRQRRESYQCRIVMNAPNLCSVQTS